MIKAIFASLCFLVTLPVPFAEEVLVDVSELQDEVAELQEILNQVETDGDGIGVRKSLEEKSARIRELLERAEQQGTQLSEGLAEKARAELKRGQSLLPRLQGRLGKEVAAQSDSAVPGSSSGREEKPPVVATLASMKLPDAPGPVVVKKGNAPVGEGRRLVRRTAPGGKQLTPAPVDPEAVERKLKRVKVDPPQEVPEPPKSKEVKKADPGQKPSRSVSLGKPFVFKWPVKKVRITSRYGLRKHPVLRKRKMHKGTDFGGGKGTPVLATGPGKVLRAGRCGGGAGICVVLEHHNGWVSRYFHLSKVDVKAGQKVGARQQIGRIGNTGRSTGPHLHFQVEQRGHHTNPEGLIGKRSDKVKAGAKKAKKTKKKRRGKKRRR